MAAIRYTPEALADFQRLPTGIRLTLINILNRWAKNPLPSASKPLGSLPNSYMKEMTIRGYRIFVSFTYPFGLQRLFNITSISSDQMLPMDSEEDEEGKFYVLPVED